MLLHRAALLAALLAAAAFGQSSLAVGFSQDIAPILSTKCIQCHGQTSLMAGLDLRTRDGLLKGGQHGPGVVAGKAGESSLYRHLTGQTQPQMPMGGRLSDQQIVLFKKWIDGGAEWDAG